MKRHPVALYVLVGLAAGIAAVMMLGRTTAGTSTHGLLYELDAIAAVVVGGTLLVGGRGTIFGTVLGVLIFSTLTNVFTQNNLSTSVQAVVEGLHHRGRGAAAAALRESPRPLELAAVPTNRAPTISGSSGLVLVAPRKPADASATTSHDGSTPGRGEVTFSCES